MDRAAPMPAAPADPAPPDLAPAPPDPAPDPAPGGRLIPFDHLDKICFVAHNRALGVSFAPVWQLHVRGEFDPAIARRAIAALIARYPTIAARAVSLERGRTAEEARRLAYQVDPAVTADQLFTSVDLTAADAAARRAHQLGHFNRHVDLAVDLPLRVTWARTGPEEGVLYVQQHHGIADGKAFFELLESFCRFYDQAERDPVPGPITALAKLDEATVAEPRRWRRILHRHLGYWFHLRSTLFGLLFPMGQLASNLGRDYTGDNDVTHVYLELALLERMRALRAASGCSVNDFLTTALALALYRWSDARGARPRRFNVLIPADARPRGFTGASFANHLCSYVVLVRRPLVDRPAALLADLHRQIARQARRRYHVKALLAGIQIAKLMSVAALKKIVYTAKRAGLNFSFSNLIPISPTAHGGRFACRAWRAERLEIMTPCGFLQGINTTVVRYADRLCFNFNFKASCVAAADVDDLIARFRGALDELIAAVERA
jgi:hypothetical protein